MSSSNAALTSFDVLDDEGDTLLAAAAASATRYADHEHDTFVVIVRPDADHEVVSGGGNGVLRAAVAVAAGAGNDRAWRDAPAGSTIESSPKALPEVISASADAAGIRRVHAGRVAVDGATLAVAMWFEATEGDTTAESRAGVLESLRVAAEHAVRAATEQAAERAAAAPVVLADATDDGLRTFDPSDPRLDPVTGVLRAEMFEAVVEDYEDEDANLVMLDIDGYDALVAQYGDEAVAPVLRRTADRLIENSRRDDVVARLGVDRFVVLYRDVTRSDVLGIAKRLVGALHEPLELADGPADITTTIAVAHQEGLVDLEEMLDSASAAIESGKRAGSGRLVLAA
jgi:diguanylate cyclase (GGDEF)-like protein